MTDGKRVRIDESGAVKIPQAMLDQLDWGEGTYLELRLEDGSVHASKIEFDPFAEALRAPDTDAFDRRVAEESSEKTDALADFERRLRESPEARPEDRPDHWR